MKKKLSLAAIAAFAVFSLNSCCTLNYNASLGGEGAMGTKVGEAKSRVILSLVSGGGEKATIKQAAENGGIKNVKQVEYSDKSICFGLVVFHTTRVYGE